MSSSPVAVAASDPGADSGGRADPKQPEAVDASSEPAGDSDATMTEASEEAPVVVAAAAEVKEEGRGALTADAVPEEADAATLVVDPLYATEAAGMVVAEGGGDESVLGAAQGLDGTDCGETKAGALTGEAERKPVPAGDVAGEAVVEACGSATSEHAEAGKEAPVNSMYCSSMPRFLACITE